MFGSLQPPTVEQLSYTLEQLVYEGDLTPEQAVAEIVDYSEMRGIDIPDEILDTQYNTMRQLTEIANAGGITDQERARLAEIQREQSAYVRGQNEALRQEFERRGVSGAGQEFLQRQMASQSAAQTASQQAMDARAAAEQRALEALTKSGQMAGDIRGQEYQQQRDIAQAQDAISRFNAQQKQQMVLQNLAARQAAAERNIAEKQRISDANVGIRNIQAAMPADIAREQYQYDVDKIKGQAGAWDTLAGANTALGKARTSGAQQIASTAGQVIGGAAAMFSDEDVKTNVRDITDEDVTRFLDTLAGKKYNYEDGYGPPGEQMGVMAQDIELSELGDTMVNETPQGKTVEYDIGALAAALGQINDRLRQLEGQ